MIVTCENCKHSKQCVNDKNFVECLYFEKTFQKDFYCKNGEQATIEKTISEYIKKMGIDETAEFISYKDGVLAIKPNDKQRANPISFIKQWLETKVKK